MDQCTGTLIDQSTQAEAEELYSNLYQESENFVFYGLDLTTHAYLGFSDSSKNILGYSSDELRQSGLEGFIHQIHPNDLTRINAAIEADAAREIFPKIEYRFRHKDTFFRPVREYRFVFHDISGKPMLLIGKIELA